MRDTLARSLNSSHDFHPHTIFIEFNLKRRRKRGRSCLLGRGKQPCFRTSQRFPSTALNLITSARSRTEPSGRVPRKIRGGIRSTRLNRLPLLHHLFASYRNCNWQDGLPFFCTNETRLLEEKFNWRCTIDEYEQRVKWNCDIPRCNDPLTLYCPSI